MALQYTTQRRRNVRRKFVNHRTPKTIREKMIIGLEAMGFTKIHARTSKYEVFSHGDQNWYVGTNGALRIGKNIGETHAASPITKDLILTAPVVRPLVRGWLKENKLSIIPSEGSAMLIEKVMQAHPELAEAGPRIIRNHINTWLREEGYLTNG